MNKKLLINLSKVSFVLGFISVFTSIAVWFFAGGDGDALQKREFAERLGIFVGLWAPTFFGIANGLILYSKEIKE